MEKRAMVPAAIHAMANADPQWLAASPEAHLAAQASTFHNPHRLTSHPAQPPE
jgi:hypothetical protein